MTLVPFTHAHVPAAALLVAAGVGRLRRTVPRVPRPWSEPEHVARVLHGLVDHGAGLAALDDEQLVGFQAAITVDGRGGRWTYTSDVGHAAPPDPLGRVRARLYGGLAGGWLRAACPEHVVSVLADDEPALATYAALGFGHHVVDLVGEIGPVERRPLPPGVELRRADPADAAAVSGLEAGLRRHLEASPIFLGSAPVVPAEVARRELADDARATFLAERAGRAVAFLRIGPCADDVATIVRDPGTASVTAAFTEPGLRGLDIGSHLLAAAVGWAEGAGYARWAVDHESANGEASRFWSRHALPVTISMSRRLSPALVP